MRPFGIVPGKVAPETRLEFRAGVRWPQIDVLILDGTPEPLHKHIIQGPSLAIHADSDAVLLEYREKAFRGELCALIAIEDFRRSISA